MRRLLIATALTPVALGVSITPAFAETVVSTAVTTPVATGTANDDLRISSTGSVKPAGGAAVTINSNDSVKNEGAIAITGANGSTGILANTNLSGNITNTGTITIDEAFTPTDSDNDGDLDGPFAQGNNRLEFTSSVAARSPAISPTAGRSRSRAISPPESRSAARSPDR